jgi:hypothetical protein
MQGPYEFAKWCAQSAAREVCKKLMDYVSTAVTDNPMRTAARGNVATAPSQRDEIAPPDARYYLGPPAGGVKAQ